MAADDLYSTIAAEARNVPERERERRRRVARLEGARLDVTHPPTGLRIRLLEERGHLEPTLALDAEEAAQIDRELQATSGVVARRLSEQYRESLYA